MPSPFSRCFSACVEISGTPWRVPFVLGLLWLVGCGGVPEGPDALGPTLDGIATIGVMPVLNATGIDLQRAPRRLPRDIEMAELLAEIGPPQTVDVLLLLRARAVHLLQKMGVTATLLGGPQGVLPGEPLQPDRLAPARDAGVDTVLQIGLSTWDYAHVLDRGVVCIEATAVLETVDGMLLWRGTTAQLQVEVSPSTLTPLGMNFEAEYPRLTQILLDRLLSTEN